MARARKPLEELKRKPKGWIAMDCRINPKYYEPLMEKCTAAGAIATKGPTKGEPSVGALLRMVASGEIKLVPKKKG